MASCACVFHSNQLFKGFLKETWVRCWSRRNQPNETLIDINFLTAAFLLQRSEVDAAIWCWHWAWTETIDVKRCWSWWQYETRVILTFVINVKNLAFKVTSWASLFAFRRKPDCLKTTIKILFNTTIYEMLTLRS